MAGTSSSLGARLRDQAALHIGARVASGMLSLYLFAMIARIYDDAQVKHIYFFLFVFGFAATALRMLGNVSAGLDSRHNRTANIRRLLTGYGEVLLASTLVVPLTVGLLWSHSPDIGWSLAASVLLILAGLDSDMLRALFGKAPLFSARFALGSAFAVALLVVLPRPTPGQAFGALLLQWLPVCIGNLWLGVRIGRRSIRFAWRSLREDGSRVVASTCVALFDGMVLNLPFFLGSRLSLDASLQIAVAVRLFSASLIFSPLVLHWSNSSYLVELSRRMKLRPTFIYFAFQWMSASICGLLFAALYHFVAGQAVSIQQLLTFWLLVFGFCIYGTVARFQGRSEKAGALSMALTVVFGLLLLLLFLATSTTQVDALLLAGFQSSALVVGACLVWFQARRTARDVNIH